MEIKLNLNLNFWLLRENFLVNVEIRSIISYRHMYEGIQQGASSGVWGGRVPQVSGFPKSNQTRALSLPFTHRQAWEWNVHCKPKEIWKKLEKVCKNGQKQCKLGKWNQEKTQRFTWLHRINLASNPYLIFQFEILLLSFQK